MVKVSLKIENFELKISVSLVKRSDSRCLCPFRIRNLQKLALDFCAIIDRFLVYAIRNRHIRARLRIAQKGTEERAGWRIFALFIRL